MDIVRAFKLLSDLTDVAFSSMESAAMKADALETAYLFKQIVELSSQTRNHDGCAMMIEQYMRELRHNKCYSRFALAEFLATLPQVRCSTVMDKYSRWSVSDRNYASVR